MPRRVVLTLLEPAADARVRMAAPAQVEVRPVGLPQLAADLRGSLGGAVVVDSSNWHLDALERVAHLVALHGARLLLYSGPGHQMNRQLATLGEHTIPEVVLRGVDDSIPHLRAAISRQLVSVPATVLHAIRRPLALLNPHIAPKIVKLFAWGRIPKTISELASTVGVTEKTLAQWHSAAGLAPPINAVRGARVARAFDLMLDGTGLSQARTMSGFGDAKRMRDAFVDFLEAAPTRATRTLTSGDAAERIATRIRKQSR